jgi:hypothetical protein
MSAFLDHGRLLRHSLLLLAASQVGNPKFQKKRDARLAELRQ